MFGNYEYERALNSDDDQLDVRRSRMHLYLNVMLLLFIFSGLILHQLLGR
ncbi:hypothetical protein GOFOIKOB_4927 [Methylobacterium tardum]|uniref:Uncharacterized protein n=1 Tax=Methylobacterium tardum TaxID=374432 RepID=A0AA37WTF0_9HYPH|nr:hypothetical protein [Methylobacterium tardum]URD35854.1 hypothetical protein M6G65_25935 [Methylobacterium tardum]GJE51863.1 hypothetical protein GOFOIKOB_4927 [Methylobacterium tardum]GLS72281.1 hypothetical protein GCM10007890_42940 [Methylobacterium tardum]